MAIYTDDIEFQNRSPMFNRRLSRDGEETVQPELQHEFSDRPSAAVIGSGVGGADISLGHQLRSVSPSEDIQKEIEALRAKGGGTLRLGSYTYKPGKDIVLYSNINIIGEGRDNTIIDFESGGNSLKMIGTASEIMVNVSIANFTIQNSNGTAGIDVDYCDFWRVENVRVTSCDQGGIRFDHSQSFSLTNVRADNNTGKGFIHLTDGTRACELFTMNFCIADTNGSDGFSFGGVSGSQQPATLSGCYAFSNTGDGFDFTAATNGGMNTILLGCGAIDNGGIGFDINSDRAACVGCLAETNTGDGFEISGQGCKVIGCRVNSNTGTDYDFSGLSNGERLIFVGNSGALSSSAEPEISMDNESINSVYTAGNLKTNSETLWMKNTSGGEITSGTVVVLGSAATGAEVTTTTVQGDDKVFGMVGPSSISNNQFGEVRTRGYTTALKVDGTTDIAIGDFLGTFTSAGIAMKAAAGDMAFAIALEAYTTDDSNGVIDALLITPRKI